MLREFSAIGLSRYTGQMAAGQLINQMMTAGSLHGTHYHHRGRLCVELIYPMGPFQMILRGERRNQNELVVEMALPSLKEKRAYLLQDPEFFEGEKDLLYLEGSEQETGETMTLCLTDAARCYREMDELRKGPVIVSCYGLSTEGKILLGIERTEEDLRAIREETARRRQILRSAREGSAEANARARSALRSEEESSEDEIMERLKEEDVFSIYDGFYYPAEKDENCFTILGDIHHIDKLMNPLSNEWVYYLELDVLGQMLRVLIHPNDLIGEPSVGRRFQGKVRFYGRLDPARLLLEDPNGFF